MGPGVGLGQVNKKGGGYVEKQDRALDVPPGESGTPW